MPTTKKNLAFHPGDSSPVALRKKVEAATRLLTLAGWSQDTIHGPLRAGGLTVVKVAPAGEPRLSIVIGRDEALAPPTSLAYSSESEFLIHWGATQVSLSQPARWTHRPGDSPGIAGDASDVWVLEDIFALGGPDKVLGGEAKLVSMTGRAHDTLAIQLGNSLAELRRLSAEIGADTADDFDQPLLRFFHQLLFIRVQEDRGAGDGPRIAELYGDVGDDELVENLETLLQRYRGTLNSELFEPAGFPLVETGATALRPLLKSLVAPWKELELDFSLSRADLAGRLYQQYMKQTPALERAGEGSRPRLLSVAVQKDEQETTAAYYTPMAVASLLASDTLGSWLRKHSPDRPEKVRLVDPACGSGSFLVAGFEQIRAHLESGGKTLRRAQREAILRESIFGADVDPKAVDITKVQLLEAAELSNHRLPDLDTNLFVGDSLASPPAEPEAQADADIGVGTPIPWQEILDRTGGGFDAVLMNPPFGAQLRLPQRYEADLRAALKNRFPAVSGWGTDLAYYFVSLAFSLMKPDACAGMIVPRTLLSGKGAVHTREHIASLASPARIVDFRGLGLFPGVRAYVAMLEFQPGAGKAELVDVADSTVDPALVLDSMLEGRNHVVRRARARRSSLTGPWTPFSLRWREVLSDQLGCEWHPLGEVGSIVVHQGTQSGSQKAFTIAEERWHKDQKGVLEVDGRHLAHRYAPLVAWARDIVPLLPPARHDRLFVPFEDDGAVTEDPEATAMLAALGGFKGRPQPGAIGALRAPKVLLRGFGAEPAAFADLRGEWITVKGTKGGLALTPKRADPRLLQGMAGLLCSSLYQWLLRGLGQPRQDETIEILQMHAEALPWPSLAEAAWLRLAAQAEAVTEAAVGEPGALRTLAYRGAREELDHLVLELLQVGPKLRATIASELVRFL